MNTMSLKLYDDDARRIGVPSGTEVFVELHPESRNTQTGNPRGTIMAEHVYRNGKRIGGGLHINHSVGRN